MLNVSARGVFAKFQAAYIFLLLPLLSGSVLNSAFAFLLAVYISYLIATLRNIKKIKIGLSDLALLLYYLILFASDANFSGLTRIIQLSILMLTFYISRDIVRPSRDYYAFLMRVMNVLVFAMAVSCAAGGDFGRYRGLTGHSNTLGGVMFHSSVMLAVMSKTMGEKYTLCRVVAFVLLIASGSRSGIFGALLFFALLYYFYHCDPEKRPRAFLSAVISICAFAVVFTFVYASLVNTEIGSVLQNLSRSYTGKNFFSGRQLLWGSIIDEIALSPLFGHGLSIIPRLFMNVSLSCHNLWLQTTLQSGIIGLLLLASFLMRILMDIRHSWLAPEGVAYVCALIFHECFEVSITQNSFAAGLIAWFILGTIAAQKGDRLNENTLCGISRQYTH